MGRGQRRKGAAGEREVAEIFTRHGFELAKRSGDAGQRDGDIDHVGIFYVEVRRRETLAIPAWLREVAAKCPPDMVGVLVFRRSRMAWQACLTLGQFLALLGDARLHVLVRSRAALNLPGWLREATIDCPNGQMAAVVFRGAEMPWHVCLSLEDLLAVSAARAAT